MAKIKHTKSAVDAVQPQAQSVELCDRGRLRQWKIKHAKATATA